MSAITINSSRYYVKFIADNGESVTVLLDAASPTLTDGFGGWEVVDRPKRPSLTRFKGRTPFRQDVAILFDGVESDDGQEIKIATLSRMAEQPSDLQPPPTISLEGTVLRKDIPAWVIESITWDNQNTMWTMDRGVPVRVRQAAVVHLLEFVDDEVLVTAPSPAVVAKGSTPTTKVTVPSGMTLRQVAQLEYGDPDRYLDILFANPWLNPDPRAVIPSGTIIAIPGKKSYKIP